jgi:hypothetical protein
MVTIELEPQEGGTCVRLTENPGGIQKPLALLPPLQLLAKARNAKSLERIERLALAEEP